MYVVSSGLTQMTIVNVTLRARLAGEYRCTVSVFRASGHNLTDATTPSINISGAITITQSCKIDINQSMFLAVTDTPTDVSIMRTGDNTVQVLWTAPASNTPPVAGYEVFYSVSGSDSTQSGGTTSNTTISLVLPMLDIMYDIFVVAYSGAANTLPSARSRNISIYLSKFNSLSVSNVLHSLGKHCVNDCPS